MSATTRLIWWCDILPRLFLIGVCVAIVQDTDSKFRLILIESRVHRLARYYKRTRVLPPNWKYESGTASALVS